VDRLYEEAHEGEEDEVRYNYFHTAVDYAWSVQDNETNQLVPGTVFCQLGRDGFEFHHTYWDGSKQVTAVVRAPTLAELDPKIEAMLND
jgi:hypothetical protein